MVTNRILTGSARLRQGFVIGVVTLLALLGYGIFRYPLIINQGGVWIVVVPVFMLVLYGVVAVWATQTPSTKRQLALRAGTRFGLIIGAIFVIMISVENFTDFSGQIITLLTLSFMFIIFLLFAVTGWRGSITSGQIRLGILASVWSALVSVLIALLFGFLVNFLFTQRLEQNLQTSAEYIRSGVQDLATFTFYNTLDSASSHLFEAPIIAAVFGTIGSLSGNGLARIQENALRKNK